MLSPHSLSSRTAQWHFESILFFAAVQHSRGLSPDSSISICTPKIEMLPLKTKQQSPAQPKANKAPRSRGTFVSSSHSARGQQDAAAGGCQQALSPSPQHRRWCGSNGSFNYMTEFLINSVNSWRHFSSNSRRGGGQSVLHAAPSVVLQQSILLPCPYPRHWEEINVWKSAFIQQKRAEKATVPGGCLHPALIFHVSGVF